MAAGSTLIGFVLFALALAAAVLLLIFVLVPLFKGIGWLVGAAFRGIGWVAVHVFEFVFGTIGDLLRLVGAMVALVLLAPLALVNLVIGRWSAAGHFAESVKRECKVAGACLYRAAVRRPLRFVLLEGVLEGVEQRVPEAMAAAPTADRPRRRAGQFKGYTILGSIRGGGSGAKLYVAAPDADVQSRYPRMPDRVVIKSFALSEGSTLPQIVRESRALECAKQLGLVFEHGMDDRRFYYVMPFHPGDHLGIVTRQLHGQADSQGLERPQLATALSYACDLVSTLCTYHRGGLWHKDVKPENIIIDGGRAHLVDLGLVTPLRSAMTLTTHGTEYFRDPELVRQALRGVKVHQINGAKFDIYAAGAVLYFMTENTFPPHGALSRFGKRSPDALRWIIRRAMADYTHRYETADEMLADLRHVAAAPDFLAVRPADLPSMHGRVADADDGAFEPEPSVAAVARAGSPAPRAPVAAPVAAAVAAAPSVPLSRPSLRVTNWWTGEYRMNDGGAAPAPPAPAEVMRRQATVLRHDVAELRGKVRSGAMSARRAAREQVRLARDRAKQIRRHARDERRRRHRRVVAERQPSVTLGLIAVVALVLVGALVLARNRRSAPPSVHVVVTEDGRVEPLAERPDGPAVLLVNDAADPESSITRGEIKRIASEYRDQGYDVVVDDVMSEGVLGELLVQWELSRGDDSPLYETIDDHLEDELHRQGLYGLLHVTGDRKLRGSLVWSSRDGAKSRRRSDPLAAPGRPGPYLLVNDHPTRFDADVAERVGALVDRYRGAGWPVIVDDEREAAVRRALPTGQFDPSAALPEVLPAVLARSGLGGILYVTAAPGDGAARDRILLRTIDAAVAAEGPAEAAPEAAAEVAPEAAVAPPAPVASPPAGADADASGIADGSPAGGPPAEAGVGGR